MIASQTLEQNLGLPKVDFFSEVLVFNRENVALEGCSWSSPGGGEVVGSAAQHLSASDEDAVARTKARAYFEFAERFALKEWLTSGGRLNDLTDLNQNRITFPCPHLPFRATPEGSSWRLALSNGVAAHVDWKAACRSALLEIYERDAVMRAWFEGLPRHEVDAPASAIGLFAPSHRLETYRLGSPIYCPTLEEPVFRFLAVAWPKQSGSAFAMSAAAGTTSDEAQKRAIAECLQIAAFLEDSSWAPEEFEPRCEPQFHQAFFQQADSQLRVRKWLREPSDAPDDAGTGGQFPPVDGFVDIAPSTWKGHMHVVKAIAPWTRELFFGIRPGRKGFQPHPFA